MTFCCSIPAIPSTHASGVCCLHLLHYRYNCLIQSTAAGMLPNTARITAVLLLVTLSTNAVRLQCLCIYLQAQAPLISAMLQVPESAPCERCNRSHEQGGCKCDSACECLEPDNRECHPAESGSSESSGGNENCISVTFPLSQPVGITESSPMTAWQALLKRRVSN